MRARDLLVVLLRAMGLLLGLLLIESVPVQLGLFIFQPGFSKGTLFRSAGFADQWYPVWLLSYVLLLMAGTGLLTLFAGRIDHRLGRRSADRVDGAERFAGKRIDVLAALIRLLAIYGLFRTIPPLQRVIAGITTGLEDYRRAMLVAAALKIVILAALSFVLLFRAGHLATWLETRPWDTPPVPDEEEDQGEEAAGAAG